MLVYNKIMSFLSHTKKEEKMARSASEGTKIKIFGGDFKTRKMLHKEADKWVEEKKVTEIRNRKENSGLVCSITVFYK